MCRVFGIGIRDMKVMPNDELETSMSWWGLAVSIGWFTVYIWCAFQSISHKQTVQGMLYKSMIKHYGEYMETIMSTYLMGYVFMVLTVLEGPKSFFWAHVLKIDASVRKLGVDVDNVKIQRHLFWMAVAQCTYNVFSAASTIFFFWTWELRIPLSKVIQAMITWNVIIICFMEYFFCAVLIKMRHSYLNGALQSVTEADHYGGLTVLTVNEAERVNRSHFVYQETKSLEKINYVSKTYSMLYDVKVAVDRRFGGIVSIVTSLSFLTIVLRMFYLMEATAGGLYSDYKRYIFFVYCNLEMVFSSLLSLLAVVYAAERVYNEDGKTANLVHQVINKQIGDEITKQASLLSMQLIHQRHKYSANGLFYIDKHLLLSAVGSITTYLIILLQFATSRVMDNIVDVDSIIFGTNATTSSLNH